MCHVRLTPTELYASYDSWKTGQFFKDYLVGKITACLRVYDIVARESEME